jgi:hypothetical protein
MERELQRQIRAYVDELKAVGLSPERVVGTVMLAASTADLRPTLGVLSKAQPDAKDRLFADMIGWCIDRLLPVRACRLTLPLRAGRIALIEWRGSFSRNYAALGPAVRMVSSVGSS